MWKTMRTMEKMQKVISKNIINDLIMNKLKSIVFIGSLLITGCAEEEVTLDLKNTGNPYQIAVKGGVFSFGGHQFLKLTVPFEQNGKAQPASGAKVEVSDGLSTYQYRETERKGEYESVEEFAGEVGKVYTLKIEYGGQTYFASDSMVAATEIDLEQIPAEERTKYRKIKQWQEDGTVGFYNHIEIHAYKHKFGCIETAKWVFGDLDTSMYVNTPKDIVLYDFPAYSHQSSIPQGVFPMQREGSGPVYNDDEDALPIQCVKMSMSNKYYEYLISVFNIVDWSGGMFSTIPGNTKTNLSNGGTGFFYASDVKIRYLGLDELLELVEMFGDKELSDEYEK